MKNSCLLLIATAVLATSMPAFSEVQTQGIVLAFDRQARTLVLTDHTVWHLNEMKTAPPDGLKAGDLVEIRSRAEDDGSSTILGIAVLTGKAGSEPGSPQFTARGKVLVFDRYAKSLMLDDRTIWSLDKMQTPIPPELKVGDRVEIDYEANEKGISSVSSIRILSQ